jgi:Capsid protein (F protein)
MALGNRNSQHDFAKTPDVKMARSQFDRSFALKDTFDFDYLVPIFVDEILPGDTVNLNVSTFARLATQKVPIMDNMMIDYFFFFVPNRLLWTNWRKMMGEQDNPGDTISFILPSLDAFPAGGPEVGTIYDKMGLPTDVAAGYTLGNTLPLRAYNLIWNEWFRDQNLQNSVIRNMDDGPDQVADYALLKRNKKHDYFTSALPWPQKGATAISLPLGTTAPVISSGAVIQIQGATTSAVGSLEINKPYIGNNNQIGFNNGEQIEFGPVTGLLADLSSATAATINQLRQAMQVQGLLELDARGGTRLTEIIQNHFNVTVPDFRLQRPEYLGGGTQKINSHPVAQTTPTSGGDAQAQLAAFATSSGSGIGFTKSFVEHGYVIGLACARADITYQQGINKMWTRSTRYDFFWPKLQELGEQTILNKEIYLQGTSADNSVFGYQERYAEYRYKPSEIHGEFRSTFATSLDFWHMAEEYGSLPALNSTFIPQNTPVDRAIAVPTAPHLLFDAWFSYKHARPMMTYSIPVTLGRF